MFIEFEDNSTVTKLKILDSNERIKDSFMLSGKKLTKSALEHAKTITQITLSLIIKKIKHVL